MIVEGWRKKKIEIDREEEEEEEEEKKKKEKNKKRNRKRKKQKTERETIMSELLQSKLHEEIVKLIAEYGYATVDEIALITGDLRRAYNVLQYLTTKGTLGTFSTHLRPSKAYYLPDRMKKIMEASGLTGHVADFYPYSYRDTGFHHHTSLIKVHLILQKIFGDKLVEYIPETLLKRDLGKKKICDGEFTFLNKKGEKKKAGIEIELTLKNAEARRKRLKSLAEYADRNLDLVIFFCNKEIIRTRTKETLQKFTTIKKPVFFMELHSFLELQSEAQAETLQGEKVSLFKPEGTK